jgi:hypothetical protein
MVLLILAKNATAELGCSRVAPIAIRNVAVTASSIRAKSATMAIRLTVIAVSATASYLDVAMGSSISVSSATMVVEHVVRATRAARTY